MEVIIIMISYCFKGKLLYCCLHNSSHVSLRSITHQYTLSMFYVISQYDLNCVHLDFIVANAVNKPVSIIGFV